MATVPFFSENWLDENQNPAGGTASGRGFSISWQNGPLGRGTDRREPNGAFVETVIKAVVDRIEFYQAGKFASQDNADALSYLKAALECLYRRTADRESRAVEGTHKL